MKTLIAAMLTALLASGLPAAEEPAGNDAGMTNVAIVVMPSIPDKIADVSAGVSRDDDGFMEMGGGDIGREHSWVEFFREMGVEWPPGSSIRHVPATGQLYIKNTPANLKKLNQVIGMLNIVPSQIEIEVQFVEFDLADIDALAKQGIVNAPSLRELWKQGRARLICAPRVVTQAGEEATVKAVNEHIYPTQFEIAPITNAAQGGVSGAVVKPSSFETREVGVILSVLPDVSPEGNIINLVMTPEVVALPTWRDYGCDFTDTNGRKQHLPMEQPFFHTHMVSTCFFIKPGQSLLIGGGGTTSKDPTKVVYEFVTARLIGIDGNPLLDPATDEWLARQEEQAGGLITRSYDVLPSIAERIADMSCYMVYEDDSEEDELDDFIFSADDDEDSTQEEMLDFGFGDFDEDEDKSTPGFALDSWKRFFKQMGVGWPEGSSIRHVPAMGRIVVKNTRNNLDIFEKTLRTLNVVPNQIEIEVQFVEFEMADMDRITAQGGRVDVDLLRQLWQDGRGRLICAPRLVTQAGEEATVKGVTECIYPTEFAFPTTSTNTNDTVVISVPVAVPGAFETRETGSILSVLPDVSPDGAMLNLTMTPEVVYDPVWKDHGFDFTDSAGNEQHVAMEQPFFYTHMFSTSISIKNGATILLGTGMTGRDPTKVVHAFATARLIDAKGDPLPVRD
jgi:type II secretory pathway component GspD/PulD (secretin)